MSIPNQQNDNLSKFQAAVLAPPFSRRVTDRNEETTEQCENPSSNSLISLNSQYGLNLPEEALHGLPGHIVRTCDPFTEADRAAVLVQLLAMFSSCVGLGPRIYRGDSNHPARINIVIAGATSKSRKGTSLSVVRNLFKRADEKFVVNCVVSGASTGEGIVQALDTHKPDVRLLVIEEEFSSVLAKMGRENNNLSQIIRSGFDRGNFEIITRKRPLKVNGGHVSYIGHITVEELNKRLKEVDIHNGFGNRFLWILAERSKLLPRNPRMEEHVIGELFDDNYSFLRKNNCRYTSFGALQRI